MHLKAECNMFMLSVLKVLSLNLLTQGTHRLRLYKEIRKIIWRREGLVAVLVRKTDSQKPSQQSQGLFVFD